MDERLAIRPKLLLVDDDPTILDLLQSLLTQQGLECSTAASGEAALKLLEHDTFQVIISDLNMPGISGLDLLKEVRQKYPYTAFLMATGVDDVRVGIIAMKQGADDYLVKPFQLEAVSASIDRALEKKRLEMQVDSYRQRLEKMVDQRTRQLQSAMSRIELTYDETLEALGAALDLRDNDTAGHSRRVTLYCLEIARAMGCSDTQLEQIARGAYLHDIGKIGIPDSILLKPGKLSEDEITIMQTHARTGYHLVRRIAFLAPAAEIVLTHQERWDGTGYPQGLAGNDIPLGARIFAIADALDAMTSDRPYRPALPLSTAREEIARMAGLQFDPEVTRIFLSTPETVWESIRREVSLMVADSEGATSPRSRTKAKTNAFLDKFTRPNGGQEPTPEN